VAPDFALPSDKGSGEAERLSRKKNVILRFTSGLHAVERRSFRRTRMVSPKERLTPRRRRFSGSALTARRQRSICQTNWSHLPLLSDMNHKVLTAYGILKPMTCKRTSTSSPGARRSWWTSRGHSTRRIRQQRRGPDNCYFGLHWAAQEGRAQHRKK